jgi:membrane protein YdbS with pleckstrin-like domain
MPLTTCPDCGREISTAAPACPHCGRPNAPVVAAPAAAAPSPSAEQTLWRGSPSWLLLLGKLIWLAIVIIVVPAALVWANNRFLPDPQVMRIVWIVVAGAIVWRAVHVVIALMRIRSTLYTVTNQRVIVESGIAEKTVEDVDLRYIDDTQFRQRIIERMLGIGNVTIVSSDRVAPRFVLHGVADPRALRELIRARSYDVSQRQLFTRAT